MPFTSRALRVFCGKKIWTAPNTVILLWSLIRNEPRLQWSFIYLFLCLIFLKRIFAEVSILIGVTFKYFKITFKWYYIFFRSLILSKFQELVLVYCLWENNYNDKKFIFISRIKGIIYNWVSLALVSGYKIIVICSIEYRVQYYKYLYYKISHRVMTKTVIT